jgi:hypothetical protein
MDGDSYKLKLPLLKMEKVAVLTKMDGDSYPCSRKMERRQTMVAVLTKMDGDSYPTLLQKAYKALATNEKHMTTLTRASVQGGSNL